MSAAGLWPCLLLAVLLHGLLLFSLEQPTPTHSQAGSTRRAALQVVQIPKSQLVPAAKAQPAARSEQSAIQDSARQEKTALQEEAGWGPVDAGDISIDYPDAPLPSGRLLLRVMVQLDAQGHFASLQSANDNEAEQQVQAAFVDAVTAGLARADFALIRPPAPAPNQQMRPATLCLEILFEERNPVVSLNWLSRAQTTTPPCQPRRRRGQS
jgi:hypothetical protein